MSSKKSVQEDLRGLDINFEMLNVKYKAIRFYPSKMTLDIEKIGETKELLNIPFAHLPKKIKKIIKPN